jgi:integrase/recombinase XerD
MNPKLHKTIEQCLIHCNTRKRLDSKTIKAYRIDLHQFEVFMENEDSPLNKDSLSLYINHIHGLYKPKTIK